MEKRNEFSDLTSTTKELKLEDLILISGGGLGYDVGFFLREAFVYLTNGGGIVGTTEAVVDFSLNYEPVN